MSFQQQLQMAIHALQSGQLQLASQYAQRCLQLQPQQADALHILALVARQQHDFAQSRLLFNQSLAINPKQAAVWSNYANLLFSQLHYQEAEQAYARALQLAPQLFDTWLNSASLALNLQQPELCLERIAKAKALQPQDLRLFQVQASALQQMQQISAAEQAYRQALELDPLHFQSWHNLGVLLRSEQRSAEALACYLKIQQAGQDVPEFRFNLGCAYYDLQQYNAAETELLAAIALRHDYIDAHEALNKLYWEQQRPTQFLQSFQQSLKQDPQSLPLRYHLASHLIQAKQDQAAEQLLAESLQLLGPQADLLHALGVQRSKQKDYQQALALTQQALSLNPQHCRALIDAANYAMQQQDYPAALQWLQRAQQLEPHNQEIWAYLGTCWRLMDAPQAKWLNDYPQLIDARPLDTPSGYRDMAHFLTDLNSAVELLHTSVQQPLDQSVQGGTQTVGRLLSEPAAVIQTFKQLLHNRVSEYLATLPKDANHPLYSRNNGQFHFAGSWSVKLANAGFHSNHVHPKGWLSACTYLKVPASVCKSDPSQAGWLKLGETSLQLPGKEQIALSICPEPGLCVLFPSYIWHGTVPFQGTDVRMTAPCDIMPGLY